jgi:hypothetical protein
MDYLNMLGDSLMYTYTGMLNNVRNWFLLIIAALLLTIPLWGYLMKILRNEKPAPDFRDWGTLFLDGLNAIVIVVIYAIPLVFAGSFLNRWLTDGGLTAKSPALAGAVLSLAVLILFFGIGLTGITGLIRFARSGRIREAFNVDGILGDILRVGWIEYSVAFVNIGLVVSIGVGIPLTLLAIIFRAIFVSPYSYFGLLYVQPALIIISLIIIPPVSVFIFRCSVQVYDRGYG